MPRFPCLFRQKYPSENAGKGISKCLGFKIFWGACPKSPLEARAFGACLPRRLLFQYSLLLKNLLKALYMYLLWSLHNFIILFLLIARSLNSAS